MKFCIINKSTDAAVTDAYLVRVAAALSVQSQRDLAGWYEVGPDQFMVASAAPPGWDQLVIVDVLGDPNAVAYHTRLSNGRPLLMVGVDMVKSLGGVFLDELSKAISHEYLETRIDPYANWWSEFDSTKMVALECADPVQGNSYTIDGVAVSDFVGPRWFDPGSDGPYNYTESLMKPLELAPGGYLIFDDGTQQFGEKFPEHKKSLVASLGRRARVKTHRQVLREHHELLTKALAAV